ncbi:hypothetical protein BJ742DRAFT_785776 [Cladochytrium replicatum]|nr:hypothetical protein BJ742DRAFT_785776 [Cladochytrium replicatum]
MASLGNLSPRSPSASPTSDPVPQVQTYSGLSTATQEILRTVVNRPPPHPAAISLPNLSLPTTPLTNALSSTLFSRSQQALGLASPTTASSPSESPSAPAPIPAPATGAAPFIPPGPTPCPPLPPLRPLAKAPPTTAPLLLLAQRNTQPTTTHQPTSPYAPLLPKPKKRSNKPHAPPHHQQQTPPEPPEEDRNNSTGEWKDSETRNLIHILSSGWYDRYRSVGHKRKSIPSSDVPAEITAAVRARAIAADMTTKKKVVEEITAELRKLGVKRAVKQVQTKIQRLERDFKSACFLERPGGHVSDDEEGGNDDEPKMTGDVEGATVEMGSSIAEVREKQRAMCAYFDELLIFMVRPPSVASETVEVVSARPGSDIELDGLSQQRKAPTVGASSAVGVVLGVYPSESNFGAAADTMDMDGAVMASSHVDFEALLSSWYIGNGRRKGKRHQDEQSGRPHSDDHHPLHSDYPHRMHKKQKMDSGPEDNPTHNDDNEPSLFRLEERRVVALEAKVASDIAYQQRQVELQSLQIDLLAEKLRLQTEELRTKSDRWEKESEMKREQFRAEMEERQRDGERRFEEFRMEMEARQRERESERKWELEKMDAERQVLLLKLQLAQLGGKARGGTLDGP